MSRISVKLTAAGITLEVTGDAEAVNAQVEKFLAHVKGTGARQHGRLTAYDAIVLVLHRSIRALTRPEIEAALHELENDDFKPPKNVPQALADAKRHKGFLAHASHGTWKLTAAGKKRAQELEGTTSTKRGQDDDV